MQHAQHNKQHSSTCVLETILVSQYLFRVSLVFRLWPSLDPRLNLGNRRNPLLVFLKFWELFERIEVPKSSEKVEDVKRGDVCVRHLKENTQKTDSNLRMADPKLACDSGCRTGYLAANEKVAVHHFLEVAQHRRELVFTHRLRNGRLQ